MASSTDTPGGASAIRAASPASTSDPEVSRRTPQRSSPSASATSTAVRAESLAKSTSTVMFISPPNRPAKARAAATVSPP